MAVAVFNGKIWDMNPQKIEYDNMVVFRNASKSRCYIRFTNPQTFGIELIGLEPESEVHLPFRRHTPTECKAFCGHIKVPEVARRAAVAAEGAGETASDVIRSLTIENDSQGGDKPLSPRLIVPWPPKKP